MIPLTYHETKIPAVTIRNLVHQYTNDLIHLFYPHICIGCGSDVIEHGQVICAQCFSELPVTDYFLFANNPVERLFAGRVLVQNSGSAFYFTKDSVLQNIMHEIKYKGNVEAGLFIGKQTGLALQQSGRFTDIDVIVPMPLSGKRMRHRGYNQSTLIAQGIAEILKKPVEDGVAIRKLNTATQTGKDRTSRWQTMQHAFTVNDREALTGKHVLLVDDIVTTGATLEACGEVIAAIPGVKLSVATAAHTIL